MFPMLNLKSYFDCMTNSCFPATGFSLKEGEDQKEITIEPAQALDEVEPLPEDCYTRPISLPEGKAGNKSPQSRVGRMLRVTPDTPPPHLSSSSDNAPPAPPAA